MKGKNNIRVCCHTDDCISDKSPLSGRSEGEDAQSCTGSLTAMADSRHSVNGGVGCPMVDTLTSPHLHTTPSHHTTPPTIKTEPTDPTSGQPDDMPYICVQPLNALPPTVIRPIAIMPLDSSIYNSPPTYIDNLPPSISLTTGKQLPDRPDTTTRLVLVQHLVIM